MKPKVRQRAEAKLRRLLAAESKEYKRARQWVSDSLLVEQGGKAGRDISVFECTIRVLGGLLSAYDLTAGTRNNKPVSVGIFLDSRRTFFFLFVDKSSLKLW